MSKNGGSKCLCKCASIPDSRVFYYLRSNTYFRMFSYYEVSKKCANDEKNLNLPRP